MTISLVLVAPDIPGNTGSIGRTCLALGYKLILIRPYGFDLTEKSVRRAGLDYWKHVNLTEYDTFNHFIEEERPQNLYLFSRFSKQTYFDAKFTPNSYLIFGSETKGLPQEVMTTYKNNLYSLPQYSDKIRSLNLANCATAVAYEAHRQTFHS